MLTFDFETTNHDFGDATNPSNRIVMVAWREDCGKVFWHYGDIMEATQFWRALDRHHHLCAFNAKFEQKWLLRLGVDIHKHKWHDPMLHEKVLQANKPVKFNLDACCKRWKMASKDPLIDGLMKAGVCPSEMPRDRLAARCVRDVLTTHTLWEATERKLQREGQLHLARTRCDFQPVLAEMEMNGMLLDTARVTAERCNTLDRHAVAQKALTEMTGGINLRSPDQMAHYLYSTLKFKELTDARGRPRRNKPSKQFPDGRPKTDKITLNALASRDGLTAEQKKFIELRSEFGKVDSALSKNLDFFAGVCVERQGKFFGKFNQTVAATDRLTSSGMPIVFSDGKKRSVQFQNMPRAFKKLFKAPKGYYIVEADAPQLEFRGAALVAQDKRAMQDILDPDFDAHCTSAAVMNNIDYVRFLTQFRDGDKTRKAQRQAAKPDTFKPLYGGTKGTPEQEAWYSEFQNRYAGVTRCQQDWLTQVEQTGCLTLPWGKKFYWQVGHNRNGLPVDKRTGRPVGPQVANYPIQSLATAEIVPISITYLHKRCKALKIRVQFINTIHDSVIAFVHEDDIAEFNEQCRMAFTVDTYRHLKKYYNVECNVPLGVEITYGQFWGEGKSIVYDDVAKWRKK